MIRALAPALLLWACGPVSEPPPDAGDAGAEACVAPTPERCGAECVSVASDARHCGGCGVACPTGAVCSGGACACPTGTSDCGGACVSLASDPGHCGACGNACGDGLVCSGGACELDCEPGFTECDGACVDLLTDPNHCFGCNNACQGGRVCEGGTCRCATGFGLCGNECLDLRADPTNCGQCGQQCLGGWECRASRCACPQGTVECGLDCADLATDERNCGACGVYCHPAQTCENGRCETPCPTGYDKCGGECVNTDVDPLHCGGCGAPCGQLSCLGGTCQTCNSSTTDCDSDGWRVSDGDCCDQPGPGCGGIPALLNPGAVELVGNGLDDNCNGLVDVADVLDAQPCDGALASNTSAATDFAKAIGICRTTVDPAPSLAAKTWGLLDAQFLQADGSALSYAGAHSVRAFFGQQLFPLEGASFAVLASGIASDGAQLNPGPNGGPTNSSIQHAATGVDIQSCTAAYCVSDWFGASRLPLKLVNQLPAAPGCGTPGAPGINFAYDSVMLVLRLRAPTNVRAFEFSGFFLSSEYPEFVCSIFNDQLVALIETPGGSPVGAVNPTDKNLMTSFEAGKYWPVGVNVAAGTDLFKVCEPESVNASCWDPDVSASSCSLGTSMLSGTGFEHVGGAGTCVNGGGTGWLTTRGNVRPGEIVELRIAIWDVSDHIRDSLAILDRFRWLATPVPPGTED